ncbi:MAG: sigma 54-interacting transcriptional regulator [Candidatus Thiodiazotropha sp.]
MDSSRGGKQLSRMATVKIDSGDYPLTIDDLSPMQSRVGFATARCDVDRGRRSSADFKLPNPNNGYPLKTCRQPRVLDRALNGRQVLDQLEFGDTRMRLNVERAKKLLERDIPFILQGETGTGKDLFAKAAHLSSSRADKPLIAVNCAALPESLIESELFGYRSGAFTGACKDGCRGKIVQANGGTLFLDEIGDMPLHLQARLLRVLEEREVIPLGGETPVEVDIRLMSATHEELRFLVEEGRFREDLYYRLNGISLQMPPLRDREDRRALILHLLEEEAGGPDRISINKTALDALDCYNWPGNIRQLRNVLRALIGLSDKAVIDLDDLPDEVFSAVSTSVMPAQNPSSHNSLDIAQRDALLRELKSARWNVTRVASRLDMSRNTLYRKMRLLDIRLQR